jgi:hypothetical protein
VDPGSGPWPTDDEPLLSSTDLATTLFAALDVATGRVEQACLPRHRHQEFLTFLKQVAKAYGRSDQGLQRFDLRKC